MELREMEPDETDFKISPKTIKRVRKYWKVVSFILSWVSVALFVWDDISAFLAYNHWANVNNYDHLQSCKTAWLVFAYVGVAITVLVTYNTLCHSLHFLCKFSKMRALKHQYTACIAFYVHEIPKSIVYLVLVSKYRIIPEVKLSLGGTVAPAVYYMGQSQYDHIYFKIIPDVMKMLALFILSVIEFREITTKDKNKVFLILNSAAMVCHQAFIIASTTLKIIIEN